ncbi:ATP-grasp domain-containing protein [Nonomuraea sp. NPDC050556]|uniref:ATP-grasp domain-containing protein n=1 Tax=Nonomuraea sp. NPDC050556 TaxID=3364369 RepID=UPI0037B487CA
MTVLITGARAPVALDLARKFAAIGERVLVAESAPAHLCARSTAVSGNFRVPPPNRAPQAFADALAAIVKREGVDLVVPTCEEIFWVARGRLGNALAAPLGQLRALHSKWEFIQLARSFGLPVPETVLVTSPYVELERPFIMKPVFSRFATKVRVVADAVGDLGGVEWVAQERLTGRQICTYSLAAGGRVVAHAAYETGFTASGACVSFEPIEHEQIESWVTKFVEKSVFGGQIAFDFIVTEDGRALPLECNPRATSGVHLFDERLAQAMISPPDEVLRPDPGTRRMIGLAMLTFGLTSGPLGEWARIMAGSRDVIAVPGDRGPFLSQFGVLWHNWLRSLWTRRSLVECSTYDIEWDGR